MSWAKLLEEAKPEGHVVQLYGQDIRFLSRNVSRYLREGLRRGEGALVIATPEHSHAFLQQLIADGANPIEATRAGRLVRLDAKATLAQFMVNGQPDQDRFEQVVGEAIEQLQPRTGNAGFRAYGEMVGLLWKAEQYSAAIRLEEYWNQLLEASAFSLFCAYPIDIFGREFQIASVDGILCAHTHLLPTDSEFESAIDRAMDEVLGPRVDGVRLLIKANFRPSWGEVPRAETIVLWLRNNLPEHADEILDRARAYYDASITPAFPASATRSLKVSTPTS